MAGLGAVLFIFVVFLLALHSGTQRDLRVAKSTEFVEEAKRRAEGLGFFFSDRRNDLDDLAVLSALEAYFLNRDLGVSLQYGLGANLEEIERAMRRLVDTRRFGGKTEEIYERMAMVDDAGAILVSVTPSDRPHSAEQSVDSRMARLSEVGEISASVRFDGRPVDPAIVVLRPLYHKGRFVGELVAWLSWGPMWSQQLSFGRQQTSVAILDESGCALCESQPDRTRVDLIERVAKMSRGDAVSVDDGGGPLLAVAVAVPGTAFRFVATIPETALFAGSAGAWLVGGLYGLALLLFASGVVIWRSSLRRDRLENELRDAQKLEAVGQLAGGIAHEINTPSQYIGNNLKFLADAHESLFALMRRCLTAIDGLREREEFAPTVQEVDDLRRKADLDFLIEEVPSATEQSIFGIEQISRIVLAMKEFSHPGTEGKAATNLNRAIENTITISRNEWKHVAKVEATLDPALPPVVCVPGEISQVVLNLLVNAAHAVRAAGRGASEGLIRVATAVEGDVAVIRVEDNGTGIPEGIRGKIFNPFFTTKEVGKGTGQGLAIARDIVVNKHGGSIHFETRTGEGTAFVVGLPLHDGARTGAGK